MAGVLRRAVDQCRRPAETDLELAYGVTRLRVPAEEIAVLVSYLEASLLEEAGGELGEAIAAHQEAARRRREREAHTLGLGWLRRTERDAGRVLEQLDDVARDARERELA